MVRRARGAEWRRALDLDGLSVVQAAAQLRVFPPIPVDDWPPELARLQVGGTSCPIRLRRRRSSAHPARAAVAAYEMTAGKAMAQAAHAAQLGWRASSAADRDAWRAGGFQLAVRTGAPRQWAAALESGAPVVHDAGFTEVEADAQTALAVLPWLVGRPAGYRASTEL